MFSEAHNYSCHPALDAFNKSRDLGLPFMLMRMVNITKAILQTLFRTRPKVNDETNVLLQTVQQWFSTFLMW